MLALLASACGQLEPLSTQEALERLNIASTKIYAADGTLIANLHGEINRDIVRLEAIPQHVQDSVVAVEDERFWQHRGIDLRAITRALLRNVSRPDDGRVEGGSTVSQQLVKNLYFPRPARTMERKLAEARVTFQFEQRYEKPEILEMYLNTIYFGRGVYGIQTAARSYFRKEVSELTLGEAAFLAGLIHEPGRYDVRDGDPPERRTDRLRAGTSRRNLVLSKMTELGFVSPQEAETAAQEELELQPRGESEWHYPYFVDMVLRQLGVLRSPGVNLLDPRFDFLGETFEERSKSVYRGGLRIYTTLDPKVQDAADEAIQKVLPDDLTQLSAAITAVEPSTGYIRAVAGGRDYYPDCEGIPDDELPALCRIAKLNLALGEFGGGSGRQPGSSFKPFVLAAALERGVSLNRTFSGSPFTHTYPGGVWNVRNYEGSGGGGMNLIEATVRSVNAAYARLEIDGVGEGDAILGAGRVADLARRMGISFPTREELQDLCDSDDFNRTGECTPADSVPSIALGAKEVSPLEMATAYSVFAHDGVRVEPTSVARITDGEGRTLYEADQPQERVLSAGVARAVTHVLEQVVRRGTGTRARLGRPSAGKTGTSQQWRDAWFVGYVPQLTAAVWVGNPLLVERNGRLEIDSMVPGNGYPFRVVGGSFPSMLWQYFMTKALDGIPVERFTPPPRSIFFSDTATPEPELASVPGVVGLTRDEAVSALTAAGFGVAETLCLARGADEGLVVRQSPTGGEDAFSGTTVTICLSVNELPSPTPPELEEGAVPTPQPPNNGDSGGGGEATMATVPDVVGESRARANSELQRAGFQMGTVRECDPSGAAESGRIWKQSPSGGTQAKTGSTVTVWYQPTNC